MQTACAAFGAAVVCSAIITPVIRGWARRRGLLDHGLTSRKQHGRPVPRLGGVAIVAAFFAPMLLLPLALDSTAAELFADAPGLVIGVVGGGLAIAALGLYDDLHGTGASTKFQVQFAAAGLAYAFGYRIDALVLPFLGVVDLGVFDLPLTLLWIAGVTNAMNLIDGLDGLAGGVALIVLVSLFSIALGRGDGLLMLFTAALAGAVLGFLFFNFNPASIFMGDTGSMFLGFMLAVVSIRASEKSASTVALLTPVIMLGLPIADTLLAMTRRGLRGVPLFSADRGHIHHRLLARGLSHRETALALYGLTACLGAVGVQLVGPDDRAALLALALLAGGTLALMYWLGFLDWKKLDEALDARRRNLERRRHVAVITGQLQRVASPSAIGPVLAAMLPALEVDRVALQAAGQVWSHGAPRRDGMSVARYGLDPERSGDNVLELGWTGGAAHVDRDTEIAVEHLCVHLRATLRRGERDGWTTPADAAGTASDTRVAPHPAVNEADASNASSSPQNVASA